MVPKKDILPIVTKKDNYIYTKSSNRILGYSKVRRGYQFIIKIKDRDQLIYKLKLGLKIGFKIVKKYLNLPE